jgi:hypothetical protein
MAAVDVPEKVEAPLLAAEPAAPEIFDEAPPLPPPAAPAIAPVDVIEFHNDIQKLPLPAKSELPANDPFNLLMHGTVLGGIALLTLAGLTLNAMFG